MSVSPATGAPSLLERGDVHKSCKSLEVLLNVLNDYCEAAGAVVTLQKRLAKALKEMASSKVTAEIPSNVLNASAAIFEALADVDGRFSKLADREYDQASGDVKKWFKKLAKEEKAHDDKINNANARIKQAAQMYEKKAKKNPRDATEEHVRYVNLISSLGPEMSQEKYNYALNVTQRHSSTIYSVAACISRIADAEWLRTCEQVRRFAPTIGVLGQWKTFCEGGWDDSMPPDLPDIQQEDDYHQLQVARDGPATNLSASPTPYETVHSNEPAPTTPTLSSAPTSYAPPKPHYLEDNTGSVRTLSAFPAPPTHVPIPPLQIKSAPQPAPLSPVAFPSAAPPAQDEETASPLPVSPHPEQIPEPEVGERDERPAPAPVSEPEASTSTGYSPVTTKTATGLIGVESNTTGNDAESVETPRAKQERSETSINTESRVAAIRHRYSESQSARTTSPGPKDVPRLPLSVSGLASRYNTGDAPSSPPLRTASPPVSRRQTLPPLDTFTPTPRAREVSPPQERQQRSNSTRRVPVESPDRRRQSEVEGELRARERRLQDMERDIRRRELDLEQSRANLAKRDDNPLDRQRRTSSQQPMAPNPPQPSPNRHHLGVPSSPLQHRDEHASSRGSNRSSTSNPSAQDRFDHAPYCGCDKCSVSKYSHTSITPSPHDLRAPERPITLRPDKPKGWIRRLSMPVGNAFSQKSSSSAGIGSPNYGVSKSGGIFSLDGRKNGSVASFTKEDGRLENRRSYDSQALGNRSMTNLGALRR